MNLHKLIIKSLIILIFDFHLVIKIIYFILAIYWNFYYNHDNILFDKDFLCESVEKRRIEIIKIT